MPFSDSRLGSFGFGNDKIYLKIFNIHFLFSLTMCCHFLCFSVLKYLSDFEVRVGFTMRAELSIFGFFPEKQIFCTNFSKNYISGREVCVYEKAFKLLI